MSETPNPESQTRLSVIMFSDIVGYGKMMNENEELAMTLLGRHNEIIRDALKKHEGKEIKVIGDAFLVSFATVASAVRCAVDIQERFSKYNESAPGKEKILLRIGIHMGDIIVKDNDVFGDGVNIASRIETLAEPGGICVSQEIYNMVKHKLDLQAVSLGPQDLKNIKEKVEIYEILVGSIAGKELATMGGRIVMRAKPAHKRPATWIVAGIVLIGIAVGCYLFQLKKPEPPSQMVSRVLKAPSSNANYPNISPDGNWVVYVARDAKEIPNLYVVNASGGEPKKITNDTVYNFKSMPCFSPSASEIIYEQSDSVTLNICKVSALGGTPRKIISNARLPIWSPDGKHITFFRYLTAADGVGLFIVNPDGTGETKIAQINPVFFLNVAWSPDSRRLAFLRNFQDTANNRYSEIFVRDVNDSTEHRITFDKKTIDDFCWTSTGEIVFNSNRGGNVSLWVMPEEGGTPKQLTLGAGSDRVPRISKDSKHLVYVNESSALNIWKADIETKTITQLIFEEGDMFSPTFSPDGKRIAYKRGYQWLEKGVQIFVCNSDGSEPVQVTPEKEYYGIGDWNHILWSKDGNSIAYTLMKRDTAGEKPDSLRYKNLIFVHDLTTNITKQIGEGRLFDWSPDGKYMLYRPDSVRRRQAIFLAPTGALEHPLKQFQSRGFASFSRDSKKVTYVDSIGVWIMPIENGRPELLFTAQKSEDLLDPQESADGKSLTVLRWNDKKNGWKLLLLPKSGGGPKELFELPPVTYVPISISPDLKTFIFVREQTSNKIMLIDNFR